MPPVEPTLDEELVSDNLALEGAVGWGSLEGTWPPVEATNSLEELDWIALEGAVGWGSSEGTPPVEATNSLEGLASIVELDTPVPPRDVKLEGRPRKPPRRSEAVEDKELGGVGRTMLSLAGMPPVDPILEDSSATDEVVAGAVGGMMLSRAGRPPVDPNPRIPPRPSLSADEVVGELVGGTMLSLGGRPPVDPWS